MKAFETWKCGEIAFIAIPCCGGFNIMSETGEHYGAWVDPDTFRKRKKREESLSLGKAELRIVHIVSKE